MANNNAASDKEKVVTKYDRKMQKRKEAERKEAKRCNRSGACSRE